MNIPAKNIQQAKKYTTEMHLNDFPPSLELLKQ